MRQAGRYLSDYREVRARVGSFLELCYTPALAAEVTLQPIRRFGFDAAILFSDILVVPDAMGVPVAFVEGEGPRLKPIASDQEVTALSADGIEERLLPVFETIASVRSALPRETALLGFCGAPWTVACYMVAGGGVPGQGPARRLSFAQPETFGRLTEVLIEASVRYLVAQFKAGVDAVQVFDTWAGVLDEDGFRRWCLDPLRRIVSGVRELVPDAPIIAFPKGIGRRTLAIAQSAGVDAIGLDWSIDLAFARDRLQPRIAVQGNLDPVRLLVGGSALRDGVEAILEELCGGPFVFNLGHGILPETPVSHVEALVEQVRRAQG
jgi:uroporphyrinogen decarboxylase